MHTMTRSDIDRPTAELRAEIASLRYEIRALESRVSAQIRTGDSEIKLGIAASRADSLASQARLARWVLVAWNFAMFIVIAVVASST